MTALTQLHTDTAVPRAEEMSAEATYDVYCNNGNHVLAGLLRDCGMDRTFIRAAEHFLWDAEGQSYLDLLGAFGALNCGHNHPRIRQRLMGVLDAPQLMQTRLNPYQAELLALLDHITPPHLKRVYLGNSGAEAVEAALKTAIAASGKHAVVYTENAFHGKTLGALALTGSDKYQKPFKGVLAEHPCIPFGDAATLDALLESRDDIAAFIVEPIQGEGGIRVPAPDYLKQVRRVCTRHGVLLIVDEIQTGLGRTGEMFCSTDAEPDMLLVGKSLGGGYIPVSAMVTTDTVWDAAYGKTETCLLHSSTFSGITTACAAASETIRVLLDEELAHNAADVGAYFLQGLKELAQRHPIVREVRGQGLLIGLQLQKPFLGNTFTENYLGQIVAARLLDEHHIIASFTLNRPDILRLEPPLTLKRADVDRVLAAFDQVFSQFPRAEYHATALVADLAAEDTPYRVDIGTIISGKIENIPPGAASIAIATDDRLAHPESTRLLTKTWDDLTPEQQLWVSARYYNADSDTNRRAVQNALDAAPSFFRTSIDRRHAALLRWRDKVEENLPVLARLGTREGFNYKSIVWQLDGILNYAHPDRLDSFKEKLAPQLGGVQASTVYAWNDKPGVVGLAPSQNGTIGLSAIGLIAAVSAGKAFVISAGYSATTFRLLELMVEAFNEENIDPAAINAVWSRSRRCIQEWARFGLDQGQVVKDEDQPPAIDYLFYWGERNQKLIDTFEARGIKGSYDLNGSDPVIVHHDADIDRAVEAVMLRYEASGQFCISPKRAIVHRDIAEAFVERLNSRIRDLRAGSLDDPRNDLMPFMRPADRQVYAAAIEEACRHDGAAVYLYGQAAAHWDDARTRLSLGQDSAYDAEGPYLTPAIVRVPADAKLKANREEMFNPLLCLQEYHTLDQALELANDSPYGIRASIWSTDEDVVTQCTLGLDTASVMANAPHLWSGPGATDLGGAKASGVNVGFGGAKFLVEELAGERKVLNFADAEAARRFVEDYNWKFTARSL